MDVVIGVDAGGTYTRAVCVGLDGQLRGRGDSGGGSPAHNANARANIRAAINGSLEKAVRSPADVVALVAGIAGFDRPSDAAWADEFIAVPGIRGRRIAVNDTEVAHAGAFGGGPGIIAIAGTGSMIFGITEAGDTLRNDQYMHYAGAARHLSFDVIHQVLLEIHPGEYAIRDAAFAHWGVRTIAELRGAVRAETAGDPEEMKRHFGSFAPVVTALAPESRLACAAIARLADSTRVGIELLALDFADDTVQVVLEGGLACSQPFADALNDAFRAAESGCRLVPPRSTPAEGAAMLALKAVGVASVLADVSPRDRCSTIPAVE